MTNALGRLRSLWQPVRLYLRFITPTRLAILTLALVGFAFIANGQGQDILRALAEADTDGTVHWPRTILFIASVALLSSILWFTTRSLLLMVRPGEPGAEDFPGTAKWLPRILGVLGYVVMIVALMSARKAYRVSYTDPRRVLLIIAGILAIGAVIFLVLSIIREAWLEAGDDAARVSRQIMILLAVLNLVLLLASAFAPLHVGHLGSATIVCLNAALWVAFGSLLLSFTDRINFPLITTICVLALIFSGFNDNHAIRKLQGRVGVRPDLAAYFRARYERLRTIAPMPANGRIPVFVVATEGGGIRAAYWTAAVLTHLQDSIRNNGGPTFADHCFAISGVSGGSLGAIVFDALRAEEIDANAKHRQFKLRPFAQAVLGEQSDSLTPTLAVMLQPDFVQRLLPFPLFRDRAEALERSWEYWWQRSLHNDRFGSGFVQMTNQYGMQMPALLINGTMVEAGNRILTTNVSNNAPVFGDTVDAFDHLGTDLRLSTSALMSARFTYVSPAGTLIDPQEKMLGHVVDGGYFENSGAETGQELAWWLRDNLPVDVWVIIIKYGPDSSGFPPPARFANELLSPFRAIFDTRGARGELAVVDIKKAAPQRALTFRLLSMGTPLPLGWLLSVRSQHAIDGAIDSQENIAAAETIRRLIAPAQPMKVDAVTAGALKAEQEQRAREQRE